MTRHGKDKQGLVLYQNLTSKAWIEAEQLDMDRLNSVLGVDYFVQWVKDRYLDVQVTQVGRSLSDFFRRLRKRPGQSIRDYVGEFDRAYARLVECGCTLRDIAAAWVFVDRMGLEEASELNLLASVGNTYDLRRLQQASIVQDRALRKPWENGRGSNEKGARREWWGKRTHTAHLTTDDMEGDPGEPNHEEDEGDGTTAVPEAVAEELYQAFMTHETAKQKYRASLHMRGTVRELASDRLKAAKAKSLCAGCKRRGHWHKDAECPLNQGKGHQTSSTSSAASGTNQAKVGSATGTSTAFQCHVVHVTWELGQGTDNQLCAITDTACTRTVAGTGWLESYLCGARAKAHQPSFLDISDSFRFGASRVFQATYAAIISGRPRFTSRPPSSMGMFPVC